MSHHLSLLYAAIVSSDHYADVSEASRSGYAGDPLSDGISIPTGGSGETDVAEPGACAAVDGLSWETSGLGDQSGSGIADSELNRQAMASLVSASSQRSRAFGVVESDTRANVIPTVDPSYWNSMFGDSAEPGGVPVPLSAVEAESESRDSVS
jgi:hypothetical protein